MIKKEKNRLLFSIISFSLKFRMVVFVLALFLFGFGLYSFSKAKYDVYPDFASLQVQIQTEAPGLTAEQVGQLVTQPLENAIVGTQGVKTVRSVSIQGLSVITVVFESSSNIYFDREKVAERMSTAFPLLPQGMTPIMTPLTSSVGVILTLGLLSDELSLMELRTLADFVIRPRLLAVPGVANVVITSEGEKQLQIQVGSENLLKYRLTLQDIVNRARLATGIQGAGYIDTFNQRIIIRPEGQSILPSELGKAVVSHAEGQSLTFNEIGTVINDQAPPFGGGLIMGKPGVILQVFNQYQANTVQVTKGVDLALQELSVILKEKHVELYDSLFKSANFVHLAIHNLEIALLIGAALVIAILFFFLLNWKTVVIALLAIPLSLVGAIIVLNAMGYSLNTMTLGGLAIALGLLVDDAVITVENIFRRLRENQTLTTPLPLYKVILKATLEVRGAVVYATLAIVLVFLPILTLHGVEGRLFSPLAVAYITATLASLIIALTFTPALSYLIATKKMKEPITISWLKRLYKKILELLEKRVSLVIGVVVLFIIGGISSLFFLKKIYLPETNENYFIIHMNFIPGTSLAESLRIGQIFTEELLEMPAIKTVAQRAGRAKEGADIHGTYQSEFDVVVETTDVQPLRQKIRELFSQFPGVDFAINSFLTERINETLVGYTSAFVINIFGNNSSELDKLAQEIADELRSIPGAVDIFMQSPPGMPEVIVSLREDDLRRWGMHAMDVLEMIKVASQGGIVGQIYEGNQIFNVVVKLKPEELNSPHSLKRLLLRNPSQNYLHLEQMADIYTISGATSVLHEGGRRVQTITCNISGQDIQTFTSNVKKHLLSKEKLPLGTYFELGGVAQEEKKATFDLLWKSLIAGLFIVLILYLILGTFPNVILILINLPFALVGGVLAVLVTGGLLSIGSMIGFITVFGITLRNSIMILLHAHHLVNFEGKSWNRDTIFQAAGERLAPILMTALATGLAILPIAIENARQGMEIEGPLAIVILGGILTSTTLNLLIFPILLNRYSRFFKPYDISQKLK